MKVYDATEDTVGNRALVESLESLAHDIYQLLHKEFGDDPRKAFMFNAIIMAAGAIYGGTNREDLKLTPPEAVYEKMKAYFLLGASHTVEREDSQRVRDAAFEEMRVLRESAPLCSKPDEQIYDAMEASLPKGPDIRH